MLFRIGSVMVLVGGVISLFRIPLSMSSSPGAPSLVLALSSVGLVWPLLGECLIVIAGVRTIATRAARRSQPAAVVGRIALERRAGVTLVGIGGALLLAIPLLWFFHGVRATAGEITFTGLLPVVPTSVLDRSLFCSWIVCLFAGAVLLIASEIELRRAA